MTSSLPMKDVEIGVRRHAATWELNRWSASVENRFFLRANRGDRQRWETPCATSECGFGWSDRSLGLLALSSALPYSVE